MVRVGSLAILVMCGACYSHARGHASCRSPGFEVAYAIASAADIVTAAVRADHADFEPEDDPAETDAINAATAALAAAPATLDRAMVANALADARPVLARCARATPRPVRISVAVMPAGTVDQIILRDHVDPATSDCVTDALHTTLFPMTKNGGSFTYPFTL
jgi:hypothetical protein